MDNIVAVIESMSLFPGEDEPTNMVCYVCMDEDLEPYLIDDEDDSNVGLMAYVVNKSWDVEESGDIGIYENCGLVKRSY